MIRSGFRWLLTPSPWLVLGLLGLLLASGEG